jgi:putative acetyltransferase
MILRDEASGDADAVSRVIDAAFGGPAESRLVRRLHQDGDTVISLVAEVAGAILGHVLLSRMEAPFAALALAPVSVAPGKQGAGVGSALIREALDRAARGDWRAVFVLGDPAYYQRFGFSRDLAAGFDSPYAGEHFMALALGGPLPAMTGRLRHPAAFATLD